MLVGIYPRVSTEDQALNGHSIDEQIDRMTKYCDAMGWTIYGVYTDAGFSGASMDRPGLSRLIRDAQSGKLDKVLVYKLDRLSRSQLDTLYLIEMVFLANGVDFVSMSENFDTTTPFGRAMIGILGVFAQLEREQIRERMSMGKLARAKEGKFGGSNHVPIGYRYINGKLVKDAYEAAQVVKIYTLYAAGKSPYQIADELNAAGYRHSFGAWNNTTIRKVLSKKTYLGYTYFRGEWYKGDHEPIVDEALFSAVQARHDRVSEKHDEQNRKIGNANSYLGGLLVCAKCGGKYSRLTQSGRSGVYHYYACNSRTKKRAELVRDPACKNKNWRERDLDELIFGEIKKLALDPDALKRTAEKTDDDRPGALRADIKKIDDQLARLMDLYALGTMPLDLLKDKVSALNEQKERIETEIENIAKDSRNRLSRAVSAEMVTTFAEILERADFGEIRAILTALIDRIELDGENVAIFWNI